MLPLAWYAIGTLACLAGWGLIRIGRAANRGHAACERLARRAVRGVGGMSTSQVNPFAARPIHSEDCT